MNPKELSVEELLERATARPWHIGSGIRSQDTIGICKDWPQHNSEETIAEVLPASGGTSEADAELICRAVNEYAKLREALETSLRIFTAWKHDANPHGDLERGESADYDAACDACERIETALANPQPSPQAHI